MTEILWDAALDCVKILPFLFLSYLAVEYTEHRMSQKTKNWIYRAGKAGPVLGGLIGIIPQCGFSAAAAGLFAGGIVTPGTLIAVFLSTSDEMLPIMLSEGLPAMMIVDAVSRLIPGVLHNDVSAEFESFQDNLLEYPQYSRPEEWHGKKVPPVLMSGHHANIEKWRREQSILRTYERRPDLLEKSNLTEKEKKWLKDQIND